MEKTLVSINELVLHLTSRYLMITSKRGGRVQRSEQAICNWGATRLIFLQDDFALSSLCSHLSPHPQNCISTLLISLILISPFSIHSILQPQDHIIMSISYSLIYMGPISKGIMLKFFCLAFQMFHSMAIVIIQLFLSLPNTRPTWHFGLIMGPLCSSRFLPNSCLPFKARFMFSFLHKATRGLFGHTNYSILWISIAFAGDSRPPLLKLGPQWSFILVVTMHKTS